MKRLIGQYTINDLPNNAIQGAVFLICILSLLPSWMNYDIIARDGAHHYVPVAQLILEGRYYDILFGPYNAQYPLPLYEVLISLVARISGLGLETSGRLVSAMCYTIGCLGIYKLTELVSQNRFISILGVVLYISNPELLNVSVDCLKESLLVCLVIWGNYYILKGILSNRKVLYFGIGSMIFLTGCMVRSTALLFLAAWMLLWVFHTREGIFYRLIIFLVPFIIFFTISFLMPDLPFFRRSFSLRFIISGITYSDFIDILQGILNVIRTFLKRSYYIVGIFGIIGLYLMRREPYARFMTVLLLAFICTYLATGWNVRGHDSSRYIFAAIITLIPITSNAMYTFLKSQKALSYWLAVLAILVCPVLWAAKSFAPPDPNRLACKEAGQWIFSKIGPNKDIITNRERIAFYAQGNIFLLLGQSDRTLTKGPKIQIAQKLPERNCLFMKELFIHDSLTRPVAIDTILWEGSSLMRLLEKKGIHPDKEIRTIKIYLPRWTHKL